MKIKRLAPWNDDRGRLILLKNSKIGHFKIPAKLDDERPFLFNAVWNQLRWFSGEFSSYPLLPHIIFMLAAPSGCKYVISSEKRVFQHNRLKAAVRSAHANKKLTHQIFALAKLLI